MSKLFRHFVSVLSILIFLLSISASSLWAAPLYCAQSLPYGDLGRSIDMVRSATGKPVWITEIGTGTDNEQWQGDYLERTFDVLAAKGAAVTIWYAYIDTMGGADGGGYGLYRPNNTIKPSGLEFTDYTFEKTMVSTQDTRRALTGVSTALQGDINGDCSVDRGDYDILVSQFGQIGSNLSADLDKDGDVDIFDHKILAENYGKACQ